MRKIYVLMLVMLAVGSLHAQIDSTLLRRIPKDTIKQTMNMDAVYNRPFIGMRKVPVALGGYVEANWQHIGTDGVSEGHQFQFRRLTLFVASTITRRIKFLSEIEFEDGAKEISVEFASIDIEFHPLLNLRGGMILNPIGSFNQNHDGPKWEFTDRPISSTQMLPATWSNAGFGLYGKTFKKNWMLGYELYLSGGFDNSIISNPTGRTSLPAAKNNKERFEEIASGKPLTTAKLAARHKKIGEIGVSYMGGIYNKWRDDGLVIDNQRRLDVFAIDFNTTLPKLKTFITGEWAWINVEVPDNYIQQFGSKQRGGFVDVVQPVFKTRFFGWDNAVFNISCRLEYVDFNVGNFRETNTNIGDELWSVMPAISFRPTQQTVLRLNYRYLQHKDVLDNPPALTGGFSFGLSSYF